MLFLNIDLLSNYCFLSRHVTSCPFRPIFLADLHGNLEEGILSVIVGVSSKMHPNRLIDCLNSFGLTPDEHEIFPVHPVRKKTLI